MREGVIMIDLSPDRASTQRILGPAAILDATRGVEVHDPSKSNPLGITYACPICGPLEPLEMGSTLSTAVRVRPRSRPVVCHA